MGVGLPGLESGPASLVGVIFPFCSQTLLFSKSIRHTIIADAVFPPCPPVFVFHVISASHHVQIYIAKTEVNESVGHNL